jgi:hypothetical protein
MRKGLLLSLPLLTGAVFFFAKLFLFPLEKKKAVLRTILLFGFGVRRLIRNYT